MFGLAAVLAGPAAMAAAPQKVVVYQAFQSIQYLPLYVAQDEGLFAKNGLDVQKVTAGSGASGVAAVIGGHADFSLQDPMTAVLSDLRGAHVVNVATVVAGVPVWAIVPKDSKLTNISQLANKSVSAALPPSTSTYLMERLIKEQKISNVTMDTVQIGTELAPMIAGRAEAGVLYEPQMDEGIAQGYKILYAFPKAYVGGYSFSTIDTLASTIKDKPEMVQAFVTSINEAEGMIAKDPALARQVAEKEFPSLPATIVDKAVNRLIAQNIYGKTAGIPEQAFRNALDLQIFIGNVKPDPDAYAKYVDNSFAQNAVQ
jgi:NitT/TauT family transport system substrate-binding protein